MATTDRDEILHALREVIDPELGVDVVGLGLVETLEVAAGQVRVGLIMTTPACPQGHFLVAQASECLRRLLGDAVALQVELLDAPPWAPERMSAAAKKALGWSLA